jgi:hypothetical protein
MNIDTLFSSNIIVPVVVAFIGFLVAVTSAVIAKEQKISEFRQGWIDNFRSDIAIIITSAYDCVFSTRQHLKHRDNIIEANAFTDKYNLSFTELEYRVTLIQLRLNPSKDNALIVQTEAVLKHISEYNRKIQLDLDMYTDECDDPVVKLKNMSHLILKNEWERVKKGEFIFRLMINLGKLFIFAMSTAMLIIIASTYFPQYCPILG